MKKILLIGETELYGGVGRMIFSFCENMDKNAVCFDFLHYKDISGEEREIINKYNGTFYKVPRYSKNLFKFYKKIKEFYRLHSFDVVHIHASTAMLMIYAFPVWKEKEVKIIYHSHATMFERKGNKVIHTIFRYFVNKFSDYKIAVSKTAAQFMYGKKGMLDAVIIKNGIYIDKYTFNLEKRKNLRSVLNIDNSFVLGHVGRLSHVKNHPFIIKVFEQLHKIDNNAKLLLIGDGEEKSKIKKMLQEKGLLEDVILYGTSDSVGEILCAMDCFIFPSHHEGNPIALIEAQANGLPVIVSNNIPEEAMITASCKALDISADSIESWVKTILEFKEEKGDRSLDNQKILFKEYDIIQVAGKIEKIYNEI